MLKLSQFNIIVPFGNGHSILYNTFTRHLSVMDSAQVESLVGGTAEKELNVIATEKGYLVDSNITESVDLIRAIKQSEEGIQAITILPTTDCNARCWYCYEKGIQHFSMSDSIADQTVSFIKNVYKESQIKINWFGGEPFYNFIAIQHITDKLCESGYVLSGFFTTNGSLITPDIVSYIVEKYVNPAMCITIDGIGVDYAKIKRYTSIPEENAFSLLLNNIRVVLQQNIRLLIRLNYTDISKAVEIKEWLESYFTSTELSLCHFYYAPVWDGSNKMKPIDCALDILSLLQKGFDINLLANPYMDNIVLNQIGNTKKMSMCPCHNKNHYVVNADGLLYRCHSLASKKEYSCGSIVTGLDISSPGYTLFDVKEEERCVGCSFSPICQTQCRVRSLIYGNDSICENTKSIVPHIIRMKAERKAK